MSLTGRNACRYPEFGRSAEARSSQNFLCNAGFVNRGQFLGKTALVENEPAIIQSEQMKDSGMPIRDTDLVLDRFVPKVVGRAEDRALLHSATCHPEAESLWVMVPTRG